MLKIKECKKANRFIIKSGKLKVCDLWTHLKIIQERH